MTTKTNELATKGEVVELTTPTDIMAFATSLKEMIIQNHLFSNIKGKNYVNVEGWQIAGAFTGIFPVVEKCENLSDETCYRYRAEVSLKDKEGATVGYGVAICTNKEAGKKGFDEYAVASMAQTRAVGKAFRLKIGWLLKVAGYETTPAEEMNATEGEVVDKPIDPMNAELLVRSAVVRINMAKDLIELRTVWDSLDDAVKHNAEVIAKKDARKAQIVKEVNENKG